MIHVSWAMLKVRSLGYRRLLCVACVVASLMCLSEYNRFVGYIEALQEADNVVSGSVPPLRSGLPFCSSQEELYPGDVYTPESRNDLQWEPAAPCRLLHFKQDEILDCFADTLAGARIVFVGDSLIDDLGSAIAQLAGAHHVVYDPPEDIPGRWWKARPNRGHFLDMPQSPRPGEPYPFLEFFWTPSTFYNDPTDHRRPNVSRAIREADIVLMNNAMWDIGDSCQNIFAFYHALKARIQRVQAAVKPGARVILHDLHWLWPNQCLIHKGQHSKCFIFNPVARVKHYRKAIRLAAACTGVHLFSDTEMTKHLPMRTDDGVHYDKFVNLMKADIFLNSICSRNRDPPFTLPVPSEKKCLEVEHFKVWENDAYARTCRKWD
eukprot:TRINITY_DN2659_c1_g1_i3.p2 TRINITY_DN2659_c1_g1~~TRINITY_DN2659_c1_g1_i3.p2  ORF type:complete len:378 (+),score=81.47 TRINITY_DN2659_c1_g1_i3:69-1202(+)